MEIERRDIEWYEDYYQVSNTWLVKSLDRTITTKSWVRRIRWRLLSTRGNKKPAIVNLSIDTNIHPVTIAQLVFTTFVRKLNKKEVVSHKDWNCWNNNLDNLLAVDSQSRLTKNNNMINKTKVRRKIFLYNLSWEFIQQFDSVRKAIDYINVGKTRKALPSNISSCLTWSTKSAYWYIRKYAE